MTASPGKVLLEMKGIGKSFPGVKALQGVSLTVREGQVHALLGENGAGKSTLIKILSGAYTKDEGEIFFEGKPVEIRGPAGRAGTGHLDHLPGVQPGQGPHRRREHLPGPPAQEGARGRLGEGQGRLAGDPRHARRRPCRSTPWSRPCPWPSSSWSRSPSR